MPAQVALRPATEADVPFLMELRHRTMDPHIRASGLEISEHEHLRRVRVRFECAEIILVDGQPCGLLKLTRDEKKWHLIQLQIAPELQGVGIGASLLQQIVAEAKQAGASIDLDVLKVNPARRLYERCGFVVIGENEHRYDMRFVPEAAPATREDVH